LPWLRTLSTTKCFLGERQGGGQQGQEEQPGRREKGSRGRRSSNCASSQVGEQPLEQKTKCRAYKVFSGCAYCANREHKWTRLVHLCWTLQTPESSCTHRCTAGSLVVCNSSLTTQSALHSVASKESIRNSGNRRAQRHLDEPQNRAEQRALRPTQNKKPQSHSLTLNTVPFSKEK
jgi:hypothetical protein